MYREILLPTDGSEGVEPAIEHAVNHARTYGARLHVLNVMDVRGEFGKHPTDMDPEKTSERLLELGEEAVGRVVRDAEQTDIEIVTDVKSGVPHRTILSYAEENDIDLIVMGTRGRTGLERTLLGSVTERVVRLSDVPVLTVHKS